MKKVLVVGAGRMGRAIAYGLHQLGVEVSITDIYDGAIADAVLNAGFPLYGVDSNVYRDYPNWDAVVSASTYTGNLEIAKWAVDNEIPYFDLGGHVGTSKEIQDYATYHNGIVFTDLGLAPGLANILAEIGYKELKDMGDTPRSISIRVGGLPNSISEGGLLQHAITWSLEGLVNEYLDDCKVLENGEFTTVPGLSGIEQLDFGSMGVFEAFNTSGGIAHTLERMKDLGLKDVNYKTIRYRGHRDKIKLLIELAGDNRLKLQDLIKQFSGGPAIRDVILVFIVIDGQHNTLTKRYIISPDNRFSAMQRATAFPVAAVVKSFLEEFYPGFFAGPLSYEEIPFLSFKNHLKTLGIEV